MLPWSKCRPATHLWFISVILIQRVFIRKNGEQCSSLLSVSEQVGRVYPQAVYFPIRTLYLTLKIEQRERYKSGMCRAGPLPGCGGVVPRGFPIHLAVDTPAPQQTSQHVGQLLASGREYFGTRTRAWSSWVKFMVPLCHNVIGYPFTWVIWSLSRNHILNF